MARISELLELIDRHYPSLQTNLGNPQEVLENYLRLVLSGLNPSLFPLGTLDREGRVMPNASSLPKSPELREVLELVRKEEPILPPTLQFILARRILSNEDKTHLFAEMLERPFLDALPYESRYTYLIEIQKVLQVPEKRWETLPVASLFVVARMGDPRLVTFVLKALSNNDSISLDYFEQCRQITESQVVKILLGEEIIRRGNEVHPKPSATYKKPRKAPLKKEESTSRRKSPPKTRSQTARKVIVID